METNTQNIEDLKLQLANALDEVRKLRSLQKRNPIQGIGGIIQRRRENLRMNITAFSEMCEISKCNLSRIERSCLPNINLKTILKISSALKISASQLMQEFEDSLKIMQIDR